jgi:predicted ester cyclase
MSGSDTEARVRRLIEVGIGGGAAAVIAELVAPDCIEHQRGHGQGVAGVHQLAEGIHRQLSDLNLRVEECAVVGDRAWVRSRVRGVSSGSVMGMAPTGQTVAIDVFDLVRVEDGRVVEHWGVADQMGLLLQLGFESAGAVAEAAAGSTRP